MQQDDHRDVTRKRADHRQPVLGILILSTFATGKEDQVKRPLRHEEAVGAMHDLLPAEVPDMRAHLLAVDGVWPLGDVYARRTLEFFVLIGDEFLNYACLPN